MKDQANGRYDVGGVLLERPFKIRRLGHFGLNALDMEAALHFYRELLGFKITDIRDHFAGQPVPPEIAKLGDHKAYFFRYASDHHAFVLNNHNVRGAMQRHKNFRREVTVNQITWQVGSLKEVVDASRWLEEQQLTIVRNGRDMPGSNWHTYVMDPDFHQNELYYGIEQIGWDGFSKPWAMHDRAFRDRPELPQISEAQEVENALAKGVDLLSGQRDREVLVRKYDVQGILLARPFRIVKIGPMGLFVEDIERSLVFYRDRLGFIVTEEVDYQGHRCVYLRANTEHHAVMLAPLALRAKLGLSDYTTTMSVGLQVANFRQLREARSFLKEHGVEILELPPELTPGIDYSFLARDKDGHCMQFYYYMEQIGWDGRPRPPGERPAAGGAWPEAVEARPDTFMGEPFLGPWG